MEKKRKKERKKEKTETGTDFIQEVQKQTRSKRLSEREYQISMTVATPSTDMM